MAQQTWDNNYSWDNNQLWDGAPKSFTNNLTPPPDNKITVPVLANDKWIVPIEQPKSRAFLGNDNVSITFPFNPDTAQWGYRENVTSMDTLGGRVVQLLSVYIDNIELQMTAGGRRSLQDIMNKLKAIMNYQTNTMNPVLFKVPSRNWNFAVYLSAVPNVGWNVASTSYPFAISLAVDQDISGVKTKQIANTVISNLAKQIGYRDDIHGGNAQKFYSIIETLPGSPPVASTGGDGTGGGDNNGGGGGPTGASGVRQTGKLSNTELVQLSAWALSKFIPHSKFKNLEDFIQQVITAVAVCHPESGGDTSQVSGANIGLWQMTPGNSNNFTKSELLQADNNAQAMAQELVDDLNLAGCAAADCAASSNPYPSGTFNHAWWCYWGAFQCDRHVHFLKNAEQAASRFNFSGYYP